MKMKRQTICIVLVMLSMLAFAALAASAQDVDNLKFPKLGKIDMPKIERVTLENGLRLYLVEDRELPVFNMSVRINCGSYLEPADKVGLADICGMVMRTGGTQKWSGDEIDELLEAVGGSVETSIGLTSANARVNMLGEYTDLGIEVLADILRKPIFDEDKIDLAKVQLRSVISRRNDDPQQILGREFNKLIYGSESVYARHSEYKTINAVSRDDLIAFHSTYFKPENVQMSIWGDFSNKEMVTKIKAYFADWERGSTEVPPLPEVDYQFDGNVHFADKTDVNQSNIFIGHIGGLTTDEDYADRIVMNNIIGGGFSSRMFSRVRSKEGLAYGTYGVYTSHIKYPGVFYNYAGTKSETTGKAIREVIKVIKSMHDEPPTDDEMRTAKESFLNSFVFRFDTKSEVVNRMMNYEFFELPEDFLHQLKDKIEKVTAEDVVTAAKKHLHPDKLQVLVVGKVSDFEVPLEELGLGPVTEIDITIPSGEEERELAITPENLARL